ncbi:MAG: hypothetical protein RSC93_12310 [Erysipelotrichaceae bacterium]
MLNQQFTYTLETKEYLGFLRYQVRNSETYTKRKLIFAWGVPVLILITFIFGRLYTQIIPTILCVAGAFAWMYLIAPNLWILYFNFKINEKTLKEMNLTGFQEVKLRFEKKQFVYRDIKSHSVLYRDVTSFEEINELLIFQYGKHQTVLLPLRLFDNKHDSDEFVKEFKTAWLQ